MNNVSTDMRQHDAIAKTVQHYVDGTKSGEGDDMKPAFHKDAMIFGYAGADLFGGPIQQLFDWSDQNGPRRSCRHGSPASTLPKQLPPFGSNSPT